MLFHNSKIDLKTKTRFDAIYEIIGLWYFFFFLVARERNCDVFFFVYIYEGMFKKKGIKESKSRKRERERERVSICQIAFGLF
jgi:hypothetical protein